MNAKNVVSPVQVAQELQRYVTEEVLRRKDGVALEAPLVESGLLDSLGLLQIVAHIEQQYGANLTQSGEPGDFRTISSLAAAVWRMSGIGAPAQSG